MDFNPLLDAYGLDVFYVSKPENVRYLSGFVEGKDGKVILTREEAVFITDGRYIVEASQQPFRYEILLNRSELPQLLNKYFRGRVGFEAEHLNVAALEDLQQANPSLQYLPTRGLIEKARAVKSSAEIEAIRAAAQLADAGFKHILPFIRPGARERDIALELEFFCRKQGSEGMAFGTTVASGVRGAQPHGGATDKAIESGELVTLDFGCVVRGYCSDMTRTVAVGAVSDTLRSIYQSVLEAQTKALEAVAAGQTGKDLDAIARNYLSGQGYGEYFSHGLGHGVGLFIHEVPSLGRTSEDRLEVGNTVTIEPGVYIPGVGGCRIEDLAVVTKTGYEVLSHSPKELIEL